MTATFPGGGGAGEVTQAELDATAAALTAAAAAHAALTTGAHNLAALLVAKADLVAGVIPSAQIPAIATGQTTTVASQAAMLAQTAAQVQPGDVTIRSDLSGRRFLLAAADPSILGNWIALEVPDSVSSVNGQQGAVTLGKNDVGLGSVDNTSDANKPLAGDSTGTLDAVVVERVRGKNVPTPGAAEDQKTWVYDHASGAMVWTPLPAAGIPASVIDAQGDAIVGTGPDAYAREPVGVNEQTLLADSSRTTGRRWGAVRAAKDRLCAPSGAIETFSRLGAPVVGQTMLLSGRLSLVMGVVLPDGFVINGVAFSSGATAGVTLTNQWFVVTDLARNVLAKTVDDGAAAWAGNTLKELAVTAPVTVVGDTPVYIGLVVAAATVPSIVSTAAVTLSLPTKPPIAWGTSTTGLTNPASLGSVAAAITPGTLGNAWGYVL